MELDRILEKIRFDGIEVRQYSNVARQIRRSAFTSSVKPDEFFDKAAFPFLKRR